MCDFVSMGVGVYEKLGLQRSKYYETVGLHDSIQRNLAVEIQKSLISNREEYIFDLLLGAVFFDTGYPVRLNPEGTRKH